MADATDQGTPLATVAGEWAALSTWVTATGNAQLVNVQLDNNLEYAAWLTTAMEGQEAAGGDTVPLTQLRADCSCTAGYRQVSATGLLKKMHEIFFACAWRAWDVAILSLVTELQPTTANGSSAPGAGQEAGNCVLHPLCYYNFPSSWPCPIGSWGWPPG